MPRKKTDAEFKKEVFDLAGGEYTFLDNYQGSNTKIKVKHNKCGNTYEVRPKDFIKGERCPNCFGNIKKTDAQFKKEVYDLVGDEYIFLDPYVNARTKIKVKHNECGNVYEIDPNHFLKGNHCPYCSGKLEKTDDQFKKEIFNIVGDEYVFLDSYVNNKTKLRVKHSKCGNVYEVAPHSFLSLHSRCPYCNSPKGETIISKILNSLGINYEYQKTFGGLRDSRLLSYDFYISTQNILIEYQGKQHYEPVDAFGGEDQFELQQKHDKLKSDYAKEHNYNLIAVPYTEDTFSKIKKYLFKHGLSK